MPILGTGLAIGIALAQNSALPNPILVIRGKDTKHNKPADDQVKPVPAGSVNPYPLHVNQWKQLLDNVNRVYPNLSPDDKDTVAFHEHLTNFWLDAIPTDNPGTDTGEFGSREIIPRLEVLAPKYYMVLESERRTLTEEFQALQAVVDGAQ
ncbi:hypothetical protein FRB99_002277 [Tulasnella sp. 403]|nr:hypothetical protein FRB99_002277 [Tulasnella sp. 403]